MQTFFAYFLLPSTPLALSDVGTPCVVALSSEVCLLEDASNLAATHQITSLKSDRLRRWTRLQQVRSSNLKNRACHYLLLLGTLLFPTWTSKWPPKLGNKIQNHCKILYLQTPACQLRTNWRTAGEARLKYEESYIKSILIAFKMFDQSFESSCWEMLKMAK